jgi:hypothetical protein
MKISFKPTKAEKYTKIIVVILLVCLIGFNFAERILDFVYLGK